MAIGRGAANFVTGLVSSFIENDMAATRREEERQYQREESQRSLQQTLALERYKAGIAEYDRNSKLADQLEATGGGDAFAHLYFTGLAGLPGDLVRQDLDPNTPTGKKNLEWFSDEKNRSAVLSYLRGSKKPSFNLDLNDPEFEGYTKERMAAKEQLTRELRQGTGYTVHRLPPVRDPDEHKAVLEGYPIEKQPRGLQEQLVSLGIQTPTLGRAGAPAKQITPLTYYRSDGTAVRAFTVDEARKLEAEGLSASKPDVTSLTTKNPITLWNKETGESKDFRPGDEEVDSLINTGVWTSQKPPTPSRVRNIMPSEGKQIEQFIKTFAESPPEQFDNFTEKWDEADNKEQATIKAAVFSRVSELRSMPEYQAEGLEYLTSLALQEVSKRLKLKPGTLDDSVVLEPEVTPQITDEGETPPTVQDASRDQVMAQARARTKLKPNEALAYHTGTGRAVVVDPNTKAFIRWAE